MKTAVSIPDELFEQAEHLAQRMKTSRSRLFSNALKEYVHRHSPDRITETLNKALAEATGETDSFIAEAAHRILDGSEW